LSPCKNSTNQAPLDLLLDLILIQVITTGMIESNNLLFTLTQLM
jgi:hypothetical protein